MTQKPMNIGDILSSALSGNLNHPGIKRFDLNDLKDFPGSLGDFFETVTSTVNKEKSDPLNTERSQHTQSEPPHILNQIQSELIDSAYRALQTTLTKIDKAIPQTERATQAKKAFINSISPASVQNILETAFQPMVTDIVKEYQVKTVTFDLVSFKFVNSNYNTNIIEELLSSKVIQPVSNYAKEHDLYHTLFSQLNDAFAFLTTHSENCKSLTHEYPLLYKADKEEFIQLLKDSGFHHSVDFIPDNIWKTSLSIPEIEITNMVCFHFIKTMIDVVKQI